MAALTYDDIWEEVVNSLHRSSFTYPQTYLSICEYTTDAHKEGKILLVHADWAEGIGKNVSGIKCLMKCGVSGIISTKAYLIKLAKEDGLVAIQRMFLFDTKGIENITDTAKGTAPHIIEIMLGGIEKQIVRLSKGRISIIVGDCDQSNLDVSQEPLRDLLGKRGASPYESKQVNIP